MAAGRLHVLVGAIGKNLRARSTSWLVWRQRQSRAARMSLWLLATIAISVSLGTGLNFAPGLMTALIVFCSMALLPLMLILLYRWISQRVLWKVRNRLILTYLLMGLSPVVLLGTLGGISSYLLAGQYATTMALLKLDEVSNEVKDEMVSQALLRLPSSTVTSKAAALPHGDASIGHPISIAVLDEGSWRPLATLNATSHAEAMPMMGQAPPSWLHSSFHGVIVYQEHLYLCSTADLYEGRRTMLVLGCMLLNQDSLARIAEGLGSISLRPGFTYMATEPGKIKIEAEPDLAKSKELDSGEMNFLVTSGGVLAPRTHFLDAPVFFGAPIPVLSWGKGESIPALMVVMSRPTLLYAHLFATSVRVGGALRAEFIGVAIFFSLLELVALLMALALSRTITRSVADLYRATKAIDAGDLDHRVRVVRRDQLGALATSFNSMASSINHLLLQQREKERLLSELAIAQEVQTTLFPRSPAYLPKFEVHAVCLPARTVGGDYFDFIFNSGTELCLAFGDISGKGIAAALLMASLHSAMRAFSLGSVTDENSPVSPARMLALINHHLYCSTQSARYATLFVACYDGTNRTLTYANGGHLPPLILSEDGRVQRLCSGGPVVGLLQGLEYTEATVQLEPGDLLIAFTDGLTEPENEFGEFGEQRLLDLIRRSQRQPLPQLAENTLKAIQNWIGHREQPDDITLLLARQL